MNQTKPAERLDYLDSARGIAALMVFFGHYINLRNADGLGVKLASLVFNANDAVSFFFVLSGMVLTYPYLQSERKLDIGRFYVGRLFRLYPAFWVAVLINALYANRYELTTHGLTDLFIRNRHQFWEEMFLVRGNNKFFGPGWTLSIEMVYSFLMPFVVLIGHYNRRLLPWLFFAAIVMAPNVGGILIHFTLGAIIAGYFQEIQSDSFKQRKVYRYRVPIIFLAVLLFSARQLTRIWPLPEMVRYIMGFFTIDLFFMSGLAAFVFIICMIRSGTFQRILQHRILLFFGRISYGVYLMHWAIVWATGDYWESKISPLFGNSTLAFTVMLVICFACTTLAATLLHYFVEMPFMAWGKKVTSKMKPTISM